ncbi:hypothetical protein PGT21_034551 [Puccinia graminis f. sp. tritici]|uniref:Uncharacterized protein n=1 Tax=Puccinia graminis f. sp. tritici TaxID=56615 RepID=A0A5B0NTM7_PUCGR|nr:hypothetical protein PGT21_034551 [Puccinia graminis f. sp. tritici]KAA1092006.1 hypothetical protein PGTUg99_012877 [Puccinia graminis f. sp. tritici]
MARDAGIRAYLAEMLSIVVVEVAWGVFRWRGMTGTQDESVVQDAAPVQSAFIEAVRDERNSRGATADRLEQTLLLL